MTPSPFHRLQTAIAQQPELPDSLTVELLAIANAASDLAAAEALVAELTRQVEDYDPYAGVGCFGEGCSVGMIAGTVRRIRGE